MVRDVKITVLDTTGVRTNSWTLLFRECNLNCVS